MLKKRCWWRWPRSDREAYVPAEPAVAAAAADAWVDAEVASATTPKAVRARWFKATGSQPFECCIGTLCSRGFWSDLRQQHMVMMQSHTHDAIACRSDHEVAVSIGWVGEP